MPTFSDVADIASSLTEVTEDGDFSAAYDAVGQLAGNTLTGFIPAWMRQTAQYIDPYYRDTSGQNTMEKAVNQVKAAIPFVSQTLPKKYDGLGNVQMRYDNPVEGFFDTFISPTDSGRIKGSEIADFLDDISDRTGNLTVYPDYQPPKSFKLKGEDITVSGELRETYQKTYGDNITALYGALMESEDFQLLSDDQQVEALRKAKEYAAQFAKAAVSDYDEVQTGIPRDIAGRIVQNQVTGAISDAFELTVENWDDGSDAAGAISDLEAAGKLFDSMSSQAKAEIRADAGGRLEYFLTARSKGVKTETFVELYKTYWDIDQKYGNDADAKAKEWSYELQKAQEARRITQSQKAALKDSMVYYQMFPAETEKFDQMIEAGLSSKKALDVAKLLEDVKGTGSVDEDGNATVRDIDTWEKLSETSLLTESERDNVIKLYMPDYDPTAANPNKTELKYDYARQELGISAEDYMDAYRAHLDNSKKDEKIAAFRELGFSEKTAENLYYLFDGSGKKKIDVVAWYEGK